MKIKKAASSDAYSITCVKGATLSSVTDITNKLKQLPQDKLSQILVAILVIYIASILANITWTLLPTASTEQAPILSAAQQQKNRNRQNGAAYDVNGVTSLNLFGEVKVVTANAEPVVEEVKTAPVTSLNLKLTATVAIDTSGNGAAVIENSGQQETYGIGDKIGNVTAVLHQVFHDRVILQVGSRHETLMLDGVEFDNRVPDSQQFNMDEDRGPPVIDNRLEGNKYQSQQDEPSDDNGDNNGDNNYDEGVAESHEDDSVKVDKRHNDELAKKLAEQREAVFEDPKKLLDFIRVTMDRKDGQIIGYRLNPAGDSKLFNLAGLKANDLAVEINGYALNDMQQAMTALKELREGNEANITVERDGSRTEILFSLNAEADRRVTSDPKQHGGKLN